MSTKTFSMKNSTLIVGGAVITGFDDGEAINISKRENQVNLTVGADGEGAATFSNDNSVELTINLLQNTVSGTVLSAIANAQRLAGGGGIPVLWSCSSGTLVEISQAFIEKDFDIAAGKEHVGKSITLIGIADVYQVISI